MNVWYRGEAGRWRDAAVKVEWLDRIEGGPGYRIKKLRYEALPGLWIPALLYEPEKLSGRVPAVLNVNGHVGAPGKAVEYKQKRCINFARQGMLALSLEWLACGELSHPENHHNFAAHLDLVGMNGLGLFYLAMRRGLDFLDQLPNADRGRLGRNWWAPPGSSLLISLLLRPGFGAQLAGQLTMCLGLGAVEAIERCLDTHGDKRAGQCMAIIFQRLRGYNGALLRKALLLGVRMTTASLEAGALATSRIDKVMLPIPESLPAQWCKTCFHKRRERRTSNTTKDLILE